MSVFAKNTTSEIQFGSDPNYTTYVYLRPLDLDPGTIEIRFETTYAKSKDPLYRQIKGQHFIGKAELHVLRDLINELLSVDNSSNFLPLERGSK